MDTLQIPAALTVSRQLDQEKLSDLTERVHKLVDSNNQLRADSIRNDKIREDMAIHYQKELNRKESLIATLQSHLDQISSENARVIHDLKTTQESEIKNLAFALDHDTRDLADKLSRAENELMSLDVFRKEKEIHDERVKSLESRLQGIEDVFAAEKEEIEKKFITEKFQLIAEHEESIKLVREQALDDAHEILRGQQKTILADNERLFADLKIHEASSEALQKERTVIHEECEELRRNLDILKEKERTYRQIGQARSTEVRKLRQRVEELESSLREASKTFTLQTSEMKATLASDLEESTLDAAGLRTLLKFKNKELKNMKSLAATILNQRQDVETFFLEALREVRDKMEKEKKAKTNEEKKVLMTKLKNGTMKTSTLKLRRIVSGEAKDTTTEVVFPKVEVKGAHLKYWDQVKDPANYVSGRDFCRDLNWEEKEVVLRSLFAKMNGKEYQLTLAKKAAKVSQLENSMEFENETGMLDEAEALGNTSGDDNY